MHTNVFLRVAVFTLAVSVSWAVPLWAQQATGQPSRTRLPAAPRAGAQRAPTPTATNGQPSNRVAQGRAVQAGARIGPPAPRAPFTLTPQQQQLLDQVLLKWENQSSRIKTFKCTFGRWEVNPVYGPKGHNYWLTKGGGEIKYKAPDHGIYIVREQLDWDRNKNDYVPRSEGLDHWVCNGTAIFEYDAAKKQLIERRLAPELKGKAIANGPLPFIFGAKADQLNRRYWMRDITPAAEVNKNVWLEAWPKFQQDAANFEHAVVILDQRTFIPNALRIILPDGKNMQDYSFTSTKVNDPLSILKGDFLPPITPFGWRKVIEAAPTAQVPEPAGQPAQASRPAAGEKR